MYAATQKTISEIRLKKLRKFEIFTAKFWHKKLVLFVKASKMALKKVVSYTDISNNLSQSH